MIKQGEIYWVDLGEPSGSGPGYRHPYVIVQNNLFNRSRIGTAVVCSITSNLQRAKAPGNVLLDSGEGGLRKRSVVNVSQIFTVDKDDIKKRIGALSQERIYEILSGIAFLLAPRDIQ